jgi:hypothetical protein
MYSLTFFGNDGEFEYVYSSSFPHVEWAFRTARIQGLTWTMDGDGWSSEETIFTEAGKAGSWYVTRTI